MGFFAQVTKGGDKRGRQRLEDKNGLFGWANWVLRLGDAAKKAGSMAGSVVTTCCTFWKSDMELPEIDLTSYPHPHSLPHGLVWILSKLWLIIKRWAELGFARTIFRHTQVSILIWLYIYIYIYIISYMSMCLMKCTKKLLVLCHFRPNRQMHAHKPPPRIPILIGSFKSIPVHFHNISCFSQNLKPPISVVA